MAKEGRVAAVMSLELSEQVLNSGEVIYERRRAASEQVLRCILTLDCEADCDYCSADIQSATIEMRTTCITPKAWAEGINQRGLPVIFTGGEPLLYEELPQLVQLIDSQIPLCIYTNLQHDVRQLLDSLGRPIEFLLSLHPSTPDFDEWDRRVRSLLEEAHFLVGINVVKHGKWTRLNTFLLARKYGDRVIACDDQRRLFMSAGSALNKKCPRVNCVQNSFLYGPDGYRYICMHLMCRGEDFGRFEHISEQLGKQALELADCRHLGFCAACSNLVEGVVTSF